MWLPILIPQYLYDQSAVFISGSRFVPDDTHCSQYGSDQSFCALSRSDVIVASGCKLLQSQAMAQTEHHALVEVLRIGTQDSDQASTPGPPVVILKDVMEVCDHGHRA